MTISTCSMTTAFYSYSTMASTHAVDDMDLPFPPFRMPTKPIEVHVYACSACGNEWDPDLFRKGTCGSCGCGEKVIREIKKESE